MVYPPRNTLLMDKHLLCGFGLWDLIPLDVALNEEITRLDPVELGDHEVWIA